MEVLVALVEASCGKFEEMSQAKTWRKRNTLLQLVLVGNCAPRRAANQVAPVELRSGALSSLMVECKKDMLSHLLAEALAGCDGRFTGQSRRACHLCCKVCKRTVSVRFQEPAALREKAGVWKR